jgi:uncharacterized protein
VEILAVTVSSAYVSDGEGSAVTGFRIGLPEKLQFLSAPAAYDGVGDDEVEAIETHMSWVFLAGGRAFKMKKPVRFPYLDFSTLAARETDCLAELTLNRRLAPGVYLGVARLTFAKGAGLRIDGEGEVVDWLVVMRRLPADRMLDRLLVAHVVGASELDQIAFVLADFYRRADRLEVSPTEYFRRLEAEHTENHEILSRRNFAIDHGRVRQMLGRMEAAFASERGRLESRAADGFLVDGHGDLRPEHVCLEREVAIFDCLEFSAVLRQVDPVDELAALTVECALLGADGFGPSLLERVTGAVGWRAPDRLYAFHLARRGLLRARLALSHLLDPAPRQAQRWEPLAARYLHIAERALDELG